MARKTLILKNVRLSYPSLFTPRVNPMAANSAPKFQAHFLIDKDSSIEDYETKKVISVKELGEMVSALAKDEFKGKAFKNHAIKISEAEEFKGLLDFNAKSNAERKPLVVDQKGKVRDKDYENEVYGGCYVNAKVNLYTVTTGGNSICGGLEAVQKFREGIRFGSENINPFGEVPETQEAVNTSVFG